MGPALPADPTPADAVPVAPPLRVVFVIQNLAGISGGSERVCIETAEAMAARGMAVRIVSFDPLAGPPAYGRGIVPVRNLWRKPRAGAALASKASGKASGKRGGRALALFKAVPNVFPLTLLKWHLSHGLFARALQGDLRADPADVVVALMPPAITAAAQACARLDLPFIAALHNVPALDFDDGPRWDQNPLYRHRARQALAGAARITVLLPEFIDWFAPALRARVVVMPNPVGRLAPASDPPPPRGPLVLGVGRLTRIKRWDLLIDAFAEAAPDLPGWQLKIYGEGPEQANLAAQIARRGGGAQIHLMGTTPDIATVYDRAALLVHPSEFEGFGLSVAEAMAHGLPVLAFADCAGVNGLIHSGEDGQLLPRADAAQAVAVLRQALIDWAAAPARRAAMGQAATRIAGRFDRDSLHDAWADLLRAAVRDPAPRP
jgi:glycosyltransferase involved in cell wall biosynthesis